MKKIEEIFKVEYPKTLIFSSMKMDSNGINFVSSKGTNNGVVAKVEEVYGLKRYPANIITVPLKGTVLNATLQTEECYVAHQIAVLIPKFSMNETELLYYCLCIKNNKFRYNYGRQADRTLKELLVPPIEELPDWVKTKKIPDHEKFQEPIEQSSISLAPSQWKWFRYEDLFDIKKGKRVTKLDLISGETPFISAIDKNNGVREYVGLVSLHKGNTITVNYNGSVGEAFYQEDPYWASDDINVLYSKFKINKYIAMFLIALIRKEKYRFNYGRKWHRERMLESLLKLPVKKDGNPDFEFMEKYIKSLKYSASI